MLRAFAHIWGTHQGSPPYRQFWISASLDCSSGPSRHKYRFSLAYLWRSSHFWFHPAKICSTEVEDTKIHKFPIRKQVHTRSAHPHALVFRWKYRRFGPRWWELHRSFGRCSTCWFRGGVGGAWGRWRRSRRREILRRWVPCESRAGELRLLLQIRVKKGSNDKEG